ncbi:MAG: hypothetical protein HRT47_05790 [Candidatus Caenarcaniphilales bacterium]|nr:hypothetical protein [Candidatus Caenarcaniphilales bacterium]
MVGTRLGREEILGEHLHNLDDRLVKPRAAEDEEDGVATEDTIKGLQDRINEIKGLQSPEELDQLGHEKELAADQIDGEGVTEGKAADPEEEEGGGLGDIIMAPIEFVGDIFGGLFGGGGDEEEEEQQVAEAQPIQENLLTENEDDGVAQEFLTNEGKDPEALRNEAQALFTEADELRQEQGEEAA